MQPDPVRKDAFLYPNSGHAARLPPSTSDPALQQQMANTRRRVPSPLTSKVDLKTHLSATWEVLPQSMEATSSPGNRRKPKCPALNVYHTLWHTEVFQRWPLSICCLWFFAMVNILEQLSIISSSVTGCPKGQWHYDRLFGLDGRR